VTTARKHKKKPLPFRERLRRSWRNFLLAWPFWAFFGGYVFVLFLVAIDPLVSPFMPRAGRHKTLGAITRNSARLAPATLRRTTYPR